jgi:hypothetical protein
LIDRNAINRLVACCTLAFVAQATRLRIGRGLLKVDWKQHHQQAGSLLYFGFVAQATRLRIGRGLLEVD